MTRILPRGEHDEFFSLIQISLDAIDQSVLTSPFDYLSVELLEVMRSASEF
jgi:hypothetical protein